MKTPNKLIPVTLLAAALCCLISAETLFGQTLRMKFGFEDSGTTTTDSVAGVSLNLVNSSGAATDYHGTNGSGVYGYGRSLDFSSATPSAASPVASTTGNSTINFGTISNYTLTLWIKPATSVGNGLPRFFVLGADGTTGSGVANSLALLNSGTTVQNYINTGSYLSSSTSIPTGQWTFLAATWDGTNVQFYIGSQTGALTPLGTKAAAVSPVNVGSAFSLMLGNYLGQNRPFDGWMDDVRFYTGSASSNFINTVRVEALILPAPTDVQLNPCGQAALTWSAVNNATGYIIQRSTSSGAETDFATAATNSFVDTSVSAGSTYYYKIVATNSFTASIASTEVSATIQAGAPFSIVTQPESQTALDGSTATFSVATSGSVLSYLWQYSLDQGTNWTDLSSETSASYTTPPVTFANSGIQYRVMVIGGCGSEASQAATLTVVAERLKFAFEDTGTTTADSVAGVNLNLVNSNGIAADYHGAIGSGVYGSGRALDFSSAIPSDLGPLASATDNALINFGTITNFTFSMWLKPTAQINIGLPRFFLLAPGGVSSGAAQDTLELLHNFPTTSLKMNINTSQILAPTQAETTNQWIFLAATWDGQTMQFYRGTEEGAVSLLGSVAAPAGSVNVGSTFNLLLGNNSLRNRAVAGLMDDVRFYTGAATRSFLENVRQESLNFAAPANVQLTTCTEASLSWSAVPYATGYIIRRATTSGAETDYATSATVAFVDTAVTAGTTYYYQIVATNASEVSAASTEVSGTVQNDSLFSIVGQPTNQVTCAGSTATFAVTVSGSGLTYLWQYSNNQGTSWTDLPSETSSTYTTPVLADTDNGTQYRVIVMSGCASVPSSAASLTVVSTAPTITKQPFAQTVVAGWPATFAVTATGPGLIYQWRENGVNLTDGNGVSGSTTAVLTLTNLTTAKSGLTYDCVIGPSCLAVTSDPALLTVNANVSDNLALNFDFEDFGNGTTTTDSVNGVTLTMANSSFSPSDFHGAPGSGVSGIGRALDFATGAPGTMGGAGPLAYAVGDSTVNFGTIGSFTVTFWAKPRVAYTGFPRYFILGTYGVSDNGVADSLGVLNNTGTLSTYVNTVAVNSPAITHVTNQWRFMAATWDGQTVRLYTGTEGSPVTLLSSSSVASGPINVGSTFNLLIGNNGTQTRGFSGMMDQVRFYRGAAPIDTIESMRQSVVTPQTVAVQSVNTDKSVTLNFTGIPGYSYRVQFTTNLTPPVVWQNISTNTADGTGAWQFTDTNAVNSAAGFYRSLYQP
ncbi:MAG: LamG-like jellyroll fold domain-containing protein [Verrucomicrobiota bacterium]